MDDDELIAAVAGGDDAALRELFHRHAPWLATRLRSALAASDVEDVLQETFLALWRGAGSYRPSGQAGGWLWGIARRQAALFLRRRGPAALALADPAATAERHTADPVDAALTRLELDGAVASLGPAGSPDRQVWELMFVEDRSVAQVADALGIPEGTVKSRAHRARGRLRAALRGGQHLRAGAEHIGAEHAGAEGGTR